MNLKNKFFVGASATVMMVAGLAGATTSPSAAVSPISTKSLAESWSHATNLSLTDGVANQPQIQVSANGTRATAVWNRNDGSHAIVQSASATINGTAATWGEVKDLSVPGQNAYDQHLGLSSDGTKATLVWTRNDGSNSRIQTISATINGTATTWGTVEDLSIAGFDSSEPKVALSADGTQAAAVWSHFDDANSRVQTAVAAVNGVTATWGDVKNLSASGFDAANPRIALSANGTRATGVWSAHKEPNNRVQTASATVSGTSATWGTVNEISEPGADSYNVELGLSTDGSRATVAWKGSTGGYDTIQSTSATISGTTSTFGTITSHSEGGNNANFPQIALSADGTRSTLLWRRYNGENYVIQTTSGTISGTSSTWGDAKDLSELGRSAGGSSLGLSSDGKRATAVWYRWTGSENVIQTRSATINSTTGTWNAVTDLTQPGRDAGGPKVSLSASGQLATVVWARSDGPDNIIQSKSGKIFGSSPTPTPTPVAKKSQTLPRSATPKKIKSNGVTVLNKRRAKTSQNRPITARAQVTASRGEVRCLKLIRGKQRKLSVRTYGKCTFRLRVTYTAPGNTIYKPLRVVKTYRVKR